jgi:mycothiol synthase
VRVVENEAGEIVAHALLWDGMPNPVAVWFMCGVHPAYRGQGLATALHQWGQVRAQEAIGRVEPDVQVVLSVSALSEQEQAHALFQQLGYQHTRFYWRMGVDLPEVLPDVVVPAGIVIKNWAELGEAVSLHEIVEAKEDSFRDHWGFYEAPLDEVVQRWANLHKTDPFFDPQLYFVALDTTQNNAIAGVSLCYLPSETQPGCGYVGTLGVRRPWRRTGLGLALLQHSFHAFQQRGYTRMELHVDGSSLTGATRLYEKAGMSIVERSDRYEMVLRPGRDTLLR